MAFGTGHHGTTQGCLLALEDFIAEGGSSQRSIDIGCGTAVLAMAAARVWSGQVLATDIDRVAVDVAEANLQANGMAGQITCLEAAGLDHPEIKVAAPFDLIFANILKPPLLALAQDIADACDAGGTIILSGLLIEQGEEVQQAYEQVGFALSQRRDIGEWTALRMKKKR